MAVRAPVASAAVAAGWLAAGCLSTPRPAAGDGPGTGSDGGVDAAPQCRAGAPDPQPWPPAGIVIDSMQVADVDADGRDDLLIAAAPAVVGGPQPSRLYVMYGPLPAAAPFHYDAVVDVGVDAGVAIKGFTVRDLDGDGCPELIAAGPPVTAGGRSYAALWHHQGAVTPWSGQPVRRELVREPSDEISFAWADLAGTGRRDLAMGSIAGDLELFLGVDGAALPAPLAVTAPSCGWGYINALETRPQAGGDTLVVFDLHWWNTVHLDGQGTPVATENCDYVGAAQTLLAAPIDLDGVPPLDVLQGAGGVLGAFFLAGAGDPVSVGTAVADCGARGPDPYLEGLAVGDLGGFAEPEAVTVDYDDPNDRSYLCLLDGLAADAAQVTRNSMWELDLGPGRAHAVVIGDLRPDAAREVWQIRDDGDLHCYRRAPSPVLEACP